MTRRRLTISLTLLALSTLALIAGRPWLARAVDPATQPDLRAMNLNSIRVITANIRYAEPKDADNAWPLRRDLLVKTLLTHQPDLIGFQEDTPAQNIFLQKGLKDFAFVTAAPDEDLATAMLSSLDTLAYRKDRFELISSAAGLLRPDAIQTNPSENTFYTFAILRDTHKTFPDILFLNTHIRHDTANAIVCTTNIRKLLATQLNAHPGAAVIVTGDMNHDKTDPSYAALLDPKTPGPSLADTFNYATRKPTDSWGTYHAFTGEPAADLPSGLIFTTLPSTPAEILKDHTPDNHYPTDHFLVTTNLRVK
jgi:endonuclease/exonuclease/phosphatase family metal-dependent hydrolase